MSVAGHHLPIWFDESVGPADGEVAVWNAAAGRLESAPVTAAIPDGTYVQMVDGVLVAVNPGSVIQAALADAAPGETARLPAGVFELAAPLDGVGGFHLDGEGEGLDATGGTVLLWEGAGPAVTVNGEGDTTSNWSLRNLRIHGNGVGEIGLQLGNDDATPKSANNGELENVTCSGFTVAGAKLVSSQINSLRGLKCVDNDGDGLLIDPGAAGGSTTTTFDEGAFSRNAGRGIRIQGTNVQSMVFNVPTIEENGLEGVDIEKTNDLASDYTGIVFNDPHIENNLTAVQGTGRYQFRARRTGSGTYGMRLALIRPTFSGTHASDFECVLAGGTFIVEYPLLTSTGKGRIGALSAGDTVPTEVIMRLSEAPTVDWIIGSVGGSRFAAAQAIVTSIISQWVTASGAWVEMSRLDAGKLLVSNATGNAVNKTARFGVPHYLQAEEDFQALIATVTGSSALLNIGGGSSIANAATSVAIYSAANNATTTGNKMFEVKDGDKIAFFAATPVGKSTGWGAPSGTATKTTFDTATVTTEQLAQRVKALVDYLTSRGDIGA